MRVYVVPRTYFEVQRGTLVEEECFERCNIISINAPSRGEIPPFSPVRSAGISPFFPV